MIDVGEERGGLAGCVGCCEGFAVGGGVAPGGAQFGVGVEGGAEVRGFGGGARASTLRGGVGGRVCNGRGFRVGNFLRFVIPSGARTLQLVVIREETAGPSSGQTSALARDDKVVVELGAASKSNSSCCASRGVFFRGEVMPSISSSVARGGGAAGAALRDGEDVDGADEVGASVADGMWFSSSTGIPACAYVTARRDAR